MSQGWKEADHDLILQVYLLVIWQMKQQKTYSYVYL